MPQSTIQDPPIIIRSLPHDAEERAAVVEIIAADIVRQLGPIVALTVAAAIDETVADGQR